MSSCVHFEFLLVTPTQKSLAGFRVGAVHLSHDVLVYVARAYKCVTCSLHVVHRTYICMCVMLVCTYIPNFKKVCPDLRGGFFFFFQVKFSRFFWIISESGNHEPEGLHGHGWLL